MKNNNKGITLLELLIAMNLLTIIIFAGSSVYLSSMNIYADAKGMSQAARNAEIVIMHIRKYAKQSNTRFQVKNNSVTFSGNNTYRWDSNQITYNGRQIAANITNCIFSAEEDSFVLSAAVTATDTNGRNECTLTTRVSAGDATNA